MLMKYLFFSQKRLDLYRAHRSTLLRLTEMIDTLTLHKQTCTTCTLVSVTDALNSTYHTVVLAPGHNQSITDYELTFRDYSWRISTFHTKQNNAATNLLYSIQHQHTYNKPNFIVGHMEDTSPGNRESVTLACQLDRDVTPEYLYRNIKLVLDGNRLSFRLLSSTNEEIDALIGTFGAVEVGFGSGFNELRDEHESCTNVDGKFITNRKNCSNVRINSLSMRMDNDFY